MKKLRLLLMASMLFALAACGGKSAESEAREWSRQGAFEDENGNYLLVSYHLTEGYEGWAVTLNLDGEVIGWGIQQEGDTLHGNLRAWDENEEPFIVTISEDGEDGLLLSVEGGNTYHFSPVEIQKDEIEIEIHISTDGMGYGYVSYSEEENGPETGKIYLYPAQISLTEPAVRTFSAWPDTGSRFVKWMKNGRDYSTESRITVLLNESADFTAVLEEDPDWENPVTSFVGEYQCDKLHALVECAGANSARFVVEWDDADGKRIRRSSAGRFDTENQRVAYHGYADAVFSYGDGGELVHEETDYDDSSGMFCFNDDGTMVWHTYRRNVVFERLPAENGNGSGMTSPWRSITEAEAAAFYPETFTVPDGAENVRWSVLDSAACTAYSSKTLGVLVRLSFELDGNSYTAREQFTGDEEADQSDMLHSGRVEAEETLQNWGDGTVDCKTFSLIGEDRNGKLCRWYDAGPGITYSLCVIAKDPDSFDLMAVAEAMHN